MRKFVPVVLLAVAAGIYNNSPAVREALDEMWRRAVFPFRLVKLQTQPPDERLLMPVEGALVSSVANTWHAARPGGRQHQGQDIFAGKGTPVLSSTRGFVVRIGDAGIGGNAVFVAGAGGRTYYYAHLDRYAEGLEVGQEVQPGTVLGYVGNTGNARGTPPHLHFGVYGREGPLNPLPLLAAGRDTQPGTGD